MFNPTKSPTYPIQKSSIQMRQRIAAVGQAFRFSYAANLDVALFGLPN